MAITLGSVTLTGVNTIDVEKTANIVPLPVPTLGSESTETFDMLGVVKSITLNGIFADDTVTAKAKVAAVEALISGNQSSITFSASDVLSSDVSVKVNSIRTNWDVPGYICSYTIQLVEGV